MIGEGATQTLSKPHRLNSYPVPAWSAAQTPYVQRALPFYGHYDVTTSWDFEHPALNTDAYSPELGYSRHMVSYVPFSSNEGPLAGGAGLKLKAGPGERNRPLGEVPGVDPALTITGPLAAKFSSLTIGQRVEIQELCKWAYEVRPRGVQDIKPLLVLLQGLLRDLLQEKYVLFLGELLELRKQLEEAAGPLKRRVVELEDELASMKELFAEELRNANVKDKFKSLLGSHRQQKLSNEMSSELSEAEAQRRKLEEEAANKHEELKRLQKERSDADAQAALDRQKMTDLEAENEMLRARLMNAEAGGGVSTQRAAQAEGLCRTLWRDLQQPVPVAAVAYGESEVINNLSQVASATQNPSDIALWMEKNGCLVSGALLGILPDSVAYETLIQLPMDFSRGVVQSTPVAKCGTLLTHAATRDNSGVVRAQELAPRFSSMHPDKLALICTQVDEAIVPDLLPAYAAKTTFYEELAALGEPPEFGPTPIADLEERVRRAMVFAKAMATLRASRLKFQDDIMTGAVYAVKPGEKLNAQGITPELQANIDGMKAAATEVAKNLSMVSVSAAAEMMGKDEDRGMLREVLGMVQDEDKLSEVVNCILGTFYISMCR